MSEETPLDLITVTAFHTAEVQADRLDLSVTVHGSSFFTGRAALTKAKEVRKHLEGLMPLGISEEDITLEGVMVKSDKGTPVLIRDIARVELGAKNYTCQ